VAASDELRARVVTYANLGRLADRRNLPFLRSALATEQDAVLRSVVADAIYKCDAENSAQTLLDYIPKDADEFGRLRHVGQDLNIPTPVVSSLVAIAAEGNTEALGKALELASYTGGDDATTALFADGLQEVGRTAADELIAALRASDASLRDNAIALLGRGIQLSDEKVAHPFLKKLASIPNPPGKQPRDALTAGALADRIKKAMEAFRNSELPPPPIPGF
jgi:D-alanyl-D-alanine carboxypeptidase/D-alanyl-D-alanine-endopeptidase (penicillin-binding protein 4)